MFMAAVAGKQLRWRSPVASHSSAADPPAAFSSQESDSSDVVFLHEKPAALKRAAATPVTLEGCSSDAKRRRQDAPSAAAAASLEPFSDADDWLLELPDDDQSDSPPSPDASRPTAACNWENRQSMAAGTASSAAATSPRPVAAVASAASSSAAADAQTALPPIDPAVARSLTAQMHRLVARERGGGLKVPKSKEHWIAVGIWLASRDFPDLPFFLPLVDSETGMKLDLPVPYKSMIANLSPKYNDRDRILLHARVVQRLDAQGRLFGEVRYLCTDIAISYHLGDNAFKWIIFHPDIFQVCCNTWNSSLNRRELFEHLRIAHSKGGMVFQAAEAETTRRFLKSILDGKGIRAECILRPSAPSAAAVDAATTAVILALAARFSSKAAESLPPAVSAETIAAAGLAHMPSLEPTLQTMPNAYHLFLGAVSRAEPLWFHPSLAEQLAMGLDSSLAPAAPAAASASVAAGAEASTRNTHEHDGPGLEARLLPLVQFVSIAQEATARTPAIPSIVICNTTRPGVNSRFGRLDPAAAACFSSTLAAAAAAPPSDPPVHRSQAPMVKRRRPMRPPPICREEEEEDNQAAPASLPALAPVFPCSPLLMRDILHTVIDEPAQTHA